MQRFVPGHGEVTDKKEVQEMRNYIVDLQKLVADGIQRQQTDSNVKATPMPAAYAGWKFGDIYGFNMSFLAKTMRANSGK